jgi:hypothetical protein
VLHTDAIARFIDPLEVTLYHTLNKIVGSYTFLMFILVLLLWGSYIDRART